MKPETHELVKYRLSRSAEALEESEILYKSGYMNASVNRLYYACFYAVSALLLNEGLSSAKHSGVRSLFNQRWVKPGRVSKELGQFYRQIFDYRQKSDYTDLVFFEKKQVESLIEESKAFVNIIRSKLI
jgi:uncharacterized protein (UPF0332 family)